MPLSESPPLMTLSIKSHIGASFLRGPVTIPIDETTFQCLQGLLHHRDDNLKTLLPRLIREGYRAMMREARAGSPPLPPRWEPMFRVPSMGDDEWAAFEATWPPVVSEGV